MTTEGTVNIVTKGGLVTEQLSNADGSSLLRKEDDGTVHIGQNSIVLSDELVSASGNDEVYSSSNVLQLGNNDNHRTVIKGTLEVSDPTQANIVVSKILLRHWRCCNIVVSKILLRHWRCCNIVVSKILLRHWRCCNIVVSKILLRHWRCCNIVVSKILLRHWRCCNIVVSKILLKWDCSYDIGSITN